MELHIAFLNSYMNEPHTHTRCHKEIEQIKNHKDLHWTWAATLNKAREKLCITDHAQFIPESKMVLQIELQYPHLKTNIIQIYMQLIYLQQEHTAS